MKLTKEEQETILRRSTADQEWDICTLDPTLVRKMLKLGYTEVMKESPPTLYKFFKCPKRCISFRNAKKSLRTGRPDWQNKPKTPPVDTSF